MDECSDGFGWFMELLAKLPLLVFCGSSFHLFTHSKITLVGFYKTYSPTNTQSALEALKIEFSFRYSRSIL